MAEKVARVSRWLIPATVLLTLLAVGGWWYASQADVALRLDGAERSVTTRAATVGELLRDEEVALGAHDRVFPPRDAPVEDGMQVRVVRAEPVAVELNGALRTVWTTGDTVTDVLRELGLDAEVVRPSRSAEVRRGGRLVLRNSHEVIVAADGEETTLLTSAASVEELLRDAGVEVDGDDEVAPGADAPVEDGLAVEVTRVELETTVEERSIPYGTHRREDSSLARGKVRTVQAGRSGVERIEYRLTERDGEVVDREVVSRTTVREPVDRVLAIGTKVEHRQTGKASWYSTESMTCAHRSLPFGTRVRVVNVANGASVVCRVADRGPFIEGRVIDLARDAFAQLADPSTGVIDVRISW